MAIKQREVKNKKDENGVGTGVSGKVYDVYLRYKTAEGYSTYGKRGFLTKREAQLHESEMKVSLVNPMYKPATAVEQKRTVKEYLESWIVLHGNANLRPSTVQSYRNTIDKHIVPYVGNTRLAELSPEMLDNLFCKLGEKGLSQTSIKYTQRVLSVSLEAARKYHYIRTNPAKDVISKFKPESKIPDPYTIRQMQQLFAHCVGKEWQMIVVLSGMYGLRRGEVLGLR